MELINTVGTRVHVRDDVAARLIAAGYRVPADSAPATPARRATTRAKRTRDRGQ
ncbi:MULTISPECIES: DUF7302 family protein [Actinokineospora]|uniref:Uncharacterized protein n=1 Tax=Actinokineospora cianjurensis TaxID=585224 RepID=A0A421AYD5_9PSEU|nr:MULTISPECIES: hypothetical protein [Actinokineospora]MBM7771233.1 hypothetical protein [Actinokineospora baliensis]RLK54828.1 hypothetical protein CLV68_5216 [Actinokineospora cianjurensis]